MSLDDPLLFQAMCAVLEQMDRAFPAKDSLSLVSGVMACFWVVHFRHVSVQHDHTGIIPAQAGES